MKKRVLSILLAALMIVSLLPTVALATETAGLDNFKKVQTYTDGKFTDVEADDWFAKNVSTAYELNLMVGKSKDFFDTESNLTVAEAMTIAARLHSIYYTGKAEFEQGKPWYQAYTDYCKANGIADPADYDMKKAITRGEFAEIFANAFPADALKKINTVQDNMIPDVKKADKFSAAIYLLYRAGVLVGNDSKGTFAPDSNIKRVEVAAITTRMADFSLRESIRLVKPSSGGGSYTPPAPVVSVTSVTLDITETTINVGDPNVKLTATITPENATNKTVSWTSSDPSVATVDQEGNVHAVAAGSTTITVTTVDGNKTATCTITVNPAPVTVADILNTVEGDFPIAQGVYESPAGAWTTSDGSSCNIWGDQLYFHKDYDTVFVLLSKNVEKSGDDYIYINSDTYGYTITFHMINDVLTSIELAFSYDGSVLGGTYAPVAAPTFKAVYNTTDGANTLTFYYDNINHNGENITVYENGTANYLFDDGKVGINKWGYNGKRNEIKSVVIHSSVADYHNLTSTAYMFINLENANNLSGVENLDVDNVTDMTCMFSSFGCNATDLATVPDVSKWDTSNVTTMFKIFNYYGEKSTILTEVPAVSNWDTSNVKDMENMFYSYGAYSEVLNFNLDLSGWNVGKVNNYQNMFLYAGDAAATWSVTIPAKTGEKANETQKWYVGNGADTSKFIAPASDENFTVALGTVGEVLATVEGGFPTYEQAWVTDTGNACYEYSEYEMLNFFDGQNLCYIFTSDLVTKNGDTYVYADETATITFTMNNGKLVSITFLDDTYPQYNGTYTAPIQGCDNETPLYKITGGPYEGNKYDFSMYIKSGQNYFSVGDQSATVMSYTQASGSPMEAGKWYHFDNDFMVECTDPHHHGCN